MSRYIDVDLKECEIADKIQEISSNADVFIAVRKVLQLFPTADVEPVRHGHWIEQDRTTISKRGRIIHSKRLICSECRKPNGRHRNAFCPNCGAKMDEKG